MTVVTSPPGPENAPRERLSLPDDDMLALLREQPGVAETLTKLLGEARRATFCEAAAITLTTDGRTVAVAASEESVGAADASLAELAEGPGLQSLRAETDIMISDTLLDGRWPHWGARTASLGWRSLVSKRLVVASQTSATLNLYAAHPDAFARADLEVAEFFARYASAALASAHQRDALLEASRTRHAIGLAEGILMRRYQLGPEAAFSSLRQRGRENRTTLLVTAEAVVNDRAS